MQTHPPDSAAHTAHNAKPMPRHGSVLRRIAIGLLVLAGMMIAARLLWFGIPVSVASVLNIASPGCVLLAVLTHFYADMKQ